MRFRSLYLHIPFCVKKCNYCDFISYAVQDKRKEKEEYLPLLLKEAAYWCDHADFGGLRSVYLGGGTPTVMPELPVFISELKMLLSLADDAEITVEANPGTIDLKGLAALREAGINRLSVGIESLDDQELKAMGRIHNADTGRKTVKEAEAAGFDNISIDLIYGLPGQTAASWREILEKALLLETQHISFYGLTLSEGTPWGKAWSAGELSLPGDDLMAEMMEQGGALLTAAGFRHYEIANFARPGYESRHNLAYWRRENYLGLGVAASGFCDDRRFTNHRELENYVQAILAGRDAIGEDEVLNSRDALAEGMFLGLRLLSGIDLDQFYERYGVRPEEYFYREIGKLCSYGLVEMAENRLRLTDKGLLLANEVFMAFLP